MAMEVGRGSGLCMLCVAPADPSIAVVASGWRRLSWQGVLPFAGICARGSCWNACDAHGFLPGRFCAASL